MKESGRLLIIVSVMFDSPTDVPDERTWERSDNAQLPEFRRAIPFEIIVFPFLEIVFFFDVCVPSSLLLRFSAFSLFWFLLFWFSLLLCLLCFSAFLLFAFSAFLLL